jgi:hypothetical protein
LALSSEGAAAMAAASVPTVVCAVNATTTIAVANRANALPLSRARR